MQLNSYWSTNKTLKRIARQINHTIRLIYRIHKQDVKTSTCIVTDLRHQHWTSKHIDFKLLNIQHKTLLIKHSYELNYKITLFAENKIPTQFNSHTTTYPTTLIQYGNKRFSNISSRLYNILKSSLSTTNIYIYIQFHLKQC